MGIVARQGDLTKTHAPVVVNAGNTSLWLGSGVAGAIRTAGGDDIQTELDIISDLKYPVRKVSRVMHHLGLDPVTTYWDFPCNYGDVVVTYAGNMKAQFIFHAAVMDCKGPHKAITNAKIIRLATINCMLEARRLGIMGMAFPIFGTGVGGMDLEASTRIMIQAIQDYDVSDCLIRLYAFSDAQFAVVQRVVRDVAHW